MCRHTSFLGNGGKARWSLLRKFPFSPPSAVHSTGSFLPPLHHRRLAVRPLSAYSSASSVSSISAWRKFNAVKHVLSSLFPHFSQVQQKGRGNFYGRSKRKADSRKDCPRNDLGKISSGTRTPSQTGRQCRRPGYPSPPAAGRDRRRAAACRTTCGSRSRRS